MNIIPRATERAYVEQTKHTYIFLVPRSASKQAIAEAVSAEYKVTVEGIRTLNRKGKPTRFSRGKHAYPGTTYRQDKKYAYVTVKEGDKIPVFDDIDEKAAKKVEKEAKKADKKATESAKGDK